MSGLIELPPMDEHNRRLVGLVHPPDWVNPTPAGRYNLVVIGAGTAGLVCAAGAAGLGAKVALIERHFMGGDCLNVGCVPSKALVRAARAAADVREAGAFGVRVGGVSGADAASGANAESGANVRVDFPAVMERLRRLRAQIAPNDGAARFRDLGVDVFLGSGRFSGADSVEVADGRGGVARLRFARAVIATGARAAAPPIPGLAEAGSLTNETVFSLTELPARLAVIGAGPIGCELAQCFARFGSEVTLIEMGDRVLPREDADAAAFVQRALEHDGVRLLLSTKTKAVARRGGERVLTLSAGADLSVDAILVGIGRAPNVDGLGLETAGVTFDPKVGVSVDDHLRTSNARIFAAGDICSPFKFTHAADFMARIVIQNALFFGRKRVSALTIPWCTYTDPELAHVGLSAADAAARGIAIDTFTQPLHENDRALLDGEGQGFVRVHVAQGKDRILGATLVARHAGEMLGELTLAMTAGLGLGSIASTIHSYPTQADAVRRTGDLYNRTRLTPFVKGVFERLLALRR